MKPLFKFTALLAAFTLSVSPPLLAQTVQQSGNISYTSGGVGDDSMNELKAMESTFDLKLLLVGKSGAYLSDIKITVTDSKGTGVLLTSSEGPVLLANLPTGTYSVKAQKNGDTVEQKITVTQGKLNTVYFRFPSE